MRTIAAVTALGLSAGLAGAVLPATASSSAPAGVCQGVSRCKVVDSAKVDRNGSRDTIAVAQKPGNFVQIRVDLGRRVIAKTIKVSPYRNYRKYGGSSKIDGLRGEEIVYRVDSGAHTSYYRVLAHRNGRLKLVDAPGKTSRWVIDGSLSSYAGYHRSRPEGYVLMGVRRAYRISGTNKFRSRLVNYNWDGGWQWTGATNRRVGARTAKKYGGFVGDFQGLPRWP